MNTDVWLKKNSRVAVVYECEVDITTRAKAEFLSTGVREETVVLQEDVTGDPPYFDAYLLVPENMKYTPDEGKKIINLFLRISDVFVKNDFDFGCT